MSKKVYVINGGGGVGKDTFANLISKYVKTEVISSVDPIKSLMKNIGWTGEKTEKDRKFMSDLKDLCTEYNDLPMRFLAFAYDTFMEDEDFKDTKVLFMHIREPQEIERAVQLFNAKTILVTNPNVEHIETNHADANVGNYNYDYHIDNCGDLKHLEELALSFCKLENLIHEEQDA